MKGIAEKALENGKGLWKDQKINKGQKFNEKEYEATVVEVHSGDSISVKSLHKN